VTTDPIQVFEDERRERIQGYPGSKMAAAAAEFLKESTVPKYSYNFSWMGRPIIQYPQDIVVMQELIWSIQPDVIVETGIAHGGSLIFSASMLELNAICGGVKDIRAHNKQAIESHPMAKRIQMIQGSSIDAGIVDQVRQRVKDRKRILVCLDSNHTHHHVLEELKAYAPLTSVGSYCVVFDTVVEDLPADMYPDRSWGPGDNPKTAVHEYLKTHSEFEIDRRIHDKILISVAPDGFLKRLR
jgi:cephalosporin hydroxylase